METKIIDFIKGLMQPALTVVAVILLFAMSVSGQFPADDVFKVVIGIIIFWFGYTGVKNFTFTGNSKYSANPNTEMGAYYDAPHAASCQCPECTSYGHAPNCQCVECKGGSESTGPFETPFDREAFLELVDASVLSMYRTVNACTRLYTAQSKALNVWKFDNVKARRDCADLLIELGEAAFKEIWGVSIDYAEKHLNDESGCTTCGDKAKGCTYPDLKFKARQLGMHYYAVLLELERLYRNRSDLG